VSNDANSVVITFVILRIEWHLYCDDVSAEAHQYQTTLNSYLTSKLNNNRWYRNS